MHALPSVTSHSHPPGLCRRLARLLLASALALPACALAQSGDWSLGAYGGKYYDTEPAGVIKGRAGFLPHYLAALNVTQVAWRHPEWPLSLEIDGMIGQQFGMATFSEIAVAPALRWTGFPWNGVLPTAARVAMLGISHTTIISPLERGVDDQGSRTLNFLLMELAFAPPSDRNHEVFVRLHHRCTIFDLLNSYGANGEDFLTLGYRRYF